MAETKPTFIAGLISPEVLNNAMANHLGIEAQRIKKCSVLEIRYDLFKNEGEWEGISQKVSELNPAALILGTIRLERDGGAFKNERENERSALFPSSGLNWIDLERGADFSLAKNPAKIIRSWHLFDRVPSAGELAEFAEECIAAKAQGCKVAAMARSKSDALPLYDFAKKYENRFELLAAFAMGEAGKESRRLSLQNGANLSYGAIGNSLAPGQFCVEEF